MRGMVHRMNNILSLFHGYLGLMLDEKKLNPMMREGLERVREGAKEATELMERINAVSRPASSTTREIDPSDFFRQLSPTLDRFRTPSVGVEVECPLGLPLVCVDTSRLKLALVELVRNACEAASSRVLVKVSTGLVAEQQELFASARTSDGSWLKIEVTDDGHGIRAENAQRIYEPFFSTKKKPQAGGLGLAVALSCVQQFGGTLSHRSRGGGTVFELFIPARAGSQQLSAVA